MEPSSFYLASGIFNNATNQPRVGRLLLLLFLVALALRRVCESAVVAFAARGVIAQTPITTTAPANRIR